MKHTFSKVCEYTHITPPQWKYIFLAPKKSPSGPFYKINFCQHGSFAHSWTSYKWNHSAWNLCICPFNSLLRLWYFFMFLCVPIAHSFINCYIIYHCVNIPQFLSISYWKAFGVFPGFISIHYCMHLLINICTYYSWVNT